MIESFKTGGKLPKRVVWEIILGAKSVVDTERSMVERTVDEGVVCDVVGDTHGVSIQYYLRAPIVKSRECG